MCPRSRKRGAEDGEKRMKRFLAAGLLLSLFLIQPACTPKTDSTTDTTTTDPAVTGESAAAKADKVTTPVIVCITTKTPDIDHATVKANKKQDLFWKSHDSAYTLLFSESQWGFSEDPDAEEVVGGVKYMKISVPAGSTSRAFTIKKALGSGATEEHHYRIDYDPPVGPGDPPNGPVIIGEG